MSKDKETLILNLLEVLNRTGGPLTQQVILLSVYCKVRLISFCISHCFNLNIERVDVEVKVLGDCEHHMNISPDKS